MIRRHLNLTAGAFVLALALALLTACGGSAGDPADQGSGGAPQGSDSPAAGPRPDDFVLPVYPDWTLTGAHQEAASSVVIFRFEGDRDAVLQQYAQDLVDLGLNVAVDGFRISAEGELAGRPRPLQAEIVFQRAEELVQVTFSIRDPSQ